MASDRQQPSCFGRGLARFQRQQRLVFGIEKQLAIAEALVAAVAQ